MTSFGKVINVRLDDFTISAIAVCFADSIKELDDERWVSQLCPGLSSKTKKNGDAMHPRSHSITGSSLVRCGIRTYHTGSKRLTTTDILGRRLKDSLNLIWFNTWIGIKDKRCDT